MPWRAVEVLLDDLVRAGGRELLVELVVDLHRGCTAARGEALDLLDGHVGIGRVLLLEMLEDLGTPVTRQVTFVHTDTTSFPHGRRLNIV